MSFDNDSINGNQRPSEEPTNEDRYRLLIENMEEGFQLVEVIRGVEGELVDVINLDVNPAFAMQRGAEINPMHGQRISDQHPESDHAWLEIYDRVERTGRSESLEGCNKETGRFYHAHFFRFSAGKVGVTLHDITDRKHAEEALKEANEKLEAKVEERTRELTESEELFVKAFYGSAAATYITRLSDGKIIDANDLGFNLLGYRRDELVGRTTTEMQLWLSDQDRQRVVGELRKNGFINNMELNLRRKSGHIWNALYSAQIVDINGEKVMLSSIVDITERKKVERALEEERSRLRAIIDSLPVGVSVADASGNIVLRNRLMYDYLGRDASSKSLFDLALFRAYRPGTNVRLKGEEMPVARAFLKGEVVSDEELELLRADGERAVVLAYAKPMRDQDGKPSGAVGVFTDITRLKGLENDLKRSNDELQQFAYVASHDLREPLRMISSYLDLLEKRYEGKALDAKAKEYMHYATDGANRMQQMINDLLAYSRIDTQGGSFSRVDMNEVMGTVLKDLKASINESGATIAQDHLPTIVADKTQMVQLLENLISNAIKFRDEAAPQIHVAVRQDGNEWTFAVQDNGIGVDPRHMDYLFQMFSRLHTREEYEGTGIGLAIAKKIVERHRGRIWVESEPGKGSIFLFTIPMRFDDQEH